MGWCLVTYRDAYGWVSRRYLSRDDKPKSTWVGGLAPHPAPPAPSSAGVCVVADAATPLNVRTSPFGDLTGVALNNGTKVGKKVDDDKGRPWVQVTTVLYKNASNISGYVSAKYVSCK